jgi:hypothetical protein
MSLIAWFLLANFSSAGDPLESKTFSSPEQAAIAFVDDIQSRPTAQTVEFCSFIVKNGSQYRIHRVIKGSPDSCPLLKQDPLPEGIVANIHTHPTRFGEKELSAPGQLFSQGDINVAERDEVGSKTFLGGPAGQVLLYKRGSTVCRGKMVKYPYQIVRPGKNAKGSLPFRNDEFVYQEKAQEQSYCRPQGGSGSSSPPATNR